MTEIHPDVCAIGASGPDGRGEGRDAAVGRAPVLGGAGKAAGLQQTGGRRKGLARPPSSGPRTVCLVDPWLLWPSKNSLSRSNPHSRRRVPPDQMLLKGRWGHFHFYRNFQNNRIASTKWTSHAVGPDVRQQRPCPAPALNPTNHTTARPHSQRSYSWDPCLSFTWRGGVLMVRLWN